MTCMIVVLCIICHTFGNDCSFCESSWVRSVVAGHVMSEIVNWQCCNWLCLTEVHMYFFYENRCTSVKVQISTVPRIV